MNIKQLYRSIKNRITEFGLIDTIYFSAKRQVDRLIKSKILLYKIDLKDLSINLPDISVKLNVVEIKDMNELSDHEIETLTKYGGNAIIKQFESRLNKGHRLFCTYLENKFVGARWVYEGGSKKFFRFPLQDGNFLLLSGFVLYEYRGQGINLMMLLKTLDILKRDGLNRGYAAIKEWNIINQKSYKKAGFEFIGSFREIKILKRIIIIWSSIPEKDYI